MWNEYTHALIAVDKKTKSNVYHICMYTSEPTFEDHDHLLQELEEDPTFSINEDYVVITCPSDLFNKIKIDLEHDKKVVDNKT